MTVIEQSHLPSQRQAQFAIDSLDLLLLLGPSVSSPKHDRPKIVPPGLMRRSAKVFNAVLKNSKELTIIIR